MKRLRVRVRVPAGWDESLVWILQEQGWGKAVAEQTFGHGLLEDEAPAGAHPTAVVILLDPQKEAVFLAFLEHLASQWGWKSADWTVESEVRSEQDWESLWRSRWRAFRCAGFAVYADFHIEQDIQFRTSDIPLKLYAGSAFGTGGHASTRMALRVVADWCRTRLPDRLLDVGTGSGILALAAARLGVRSVFGMDPDPASALQARQSARLNGLDPQCRFWRGTLDSVTGRWPALVANLHSDLIRENASFWAERVTPGGRLFVGGVLDRKAPQTLQALEENGFKKSYIGQRGRWIGAALVRN